MHRGRQVVAGGNAFGEYILPLPAGFLSNVVGFANGIQRFGVIFRIRKIEQFENFFLAHTTSFKELEVTIIPKIGRGMKST